MRSLARFAAFVAILTGSALAQADGLSGLEKEHLLRGQTVSRKANVRQGPHRLVGGVAYTIVDWGPDQVASLIDDVSLWNRLIPRARDVRRIANVGDDARVAVSHGNALISVSYSMRVRRDGRLVRFWMDPTRPHDIEDVWGFFRPEALPDGRTLITFGILIDLGDGMIRDLFEGHVQELALEIPDNVRSVIVERSSRGQRAAR